MPPSLVPPSAAPPAEPAPAGTALGPWAGLFTVAGIGSILFVALLLVALALDFAAPPPVDGGVETLEFVAAHTRVYVAEQVLWIAPGILAVIVFVALFIALTPTTRTLALLGGLVGGVSYALLLAIPTSSRGSLALVYLSEQYQAAAPADRAAYAIAAETIIAENNTPTIAGVMATLGILLISIAMVRSTLARAVGWLGVVTGVFGVLGELLRYAVPQFYWVYGILLWVWFVAVGVVLIRLGRRLRRTSSAA